MNIFMWLVVALAVIFLAYVLYSGQLRWLVGVVRNMALGIVGILGANMLLGGIGLTVGVNVITVMTVGLLGLPGFLLLYGVGMLVG